MRINLPSLYLTLEADRPVTVSGAIDTEISVLDGRVWLTEEDLADDIFLFPGTTYRVRTPGRVVLDCDGQSRILVRAPVSVRTPGNRLREILVAAQTLLRRLSGAAHRHEGDLRALHELQGSL